MAPKTKPTPLPAQKREIDAQHLAEIEVMPGVGHEISSPSRVDPGAVTRPVRSSAPRLDGDRQDMATQLALDPALGAAATMSQFVVAPDGVVPTLEGLYAELDGLVRDVEEGRSLGRVERTLYVQAASLDAAFNNLLSLAAANQKRGHLSVAETYFRLAFKAQSQARTTLQALAEVVNPPGVAFVRQANINNGGQQQVNNAVPAREETIAKIASK